jgi:hypothetical protein
VIDTIYVAMSMDCERARDFTHPDASGPKDFAASADWVRAYAARAGEYGFPITYFLHPEVATGQAEVFLELEREGACLGLHLHPWKFGDGKYKAHFGGLSRDQQLAAVSEASALWQQAMGRRPDYFRPGTFSANDSTFGVLVELGFRGGSISAPERIYPDLNSIWTGAVKDPHRPHPHFRQWRGDLPFANLPHTHDYSTLYTLKSRRFYRDLRPDYLDADYRFIADNIVRQIIERAPAIPMITMDTHNDHDYTDPQDRVCGNYITMLRELNDAFERHSITPVGITMDKLCDMVHASPIEEDAFVPA